MNRIQDGDLGIIEAMALAQFATGLRNAVNALDAVELQCEPGCTCSMSRAAAAARVFLDDFDRARRGELVPGGLPILKEKSS